MDEQLKNMIMDAVKLAVANASIKAAYDMESHAVKIVPVDTGALKASIHLEINSPNDIMLTAGMDYAPHVEYGTYKQRPQPYMRPAIFNFVSTFLPERIHKELKIMSKDIEAYKATGKP